MHANAELIAHFYTCFQQKDYVGMQACYHSEATFSDPAFGDLDAKQVRAMWQMLITSAARLEVKFSDIEANNAVGKCQWEAFYDFSQTGRPIHNIIQAKFEFKDGKIWKHTDNFDLWKWLHQAMGLKGLLFGWLPATQNKVKATAKGRLEKYMNKKVN